VIVCGDRDDQETSLYSEIDDVDDYDVIGQSTGTCDETGYTLPVRDGSPGYVRHYTVPLPRIPSSNYDDAGQQPTATVVDLIGYDSPDRSAVSAGVSGQYVNESVDSQLPDAGTYDETGYMVPVDDGSPGPARHSTVPLPSPPSSYYNSDAGQDPTTTVIDPTGYDSPDRSAGVGSQYVNESVDNKSSDAYTPLQRQDNHVASSSTDDV